MDERTAPATKGDIVQLSADLSKQVLFAMKDVGDQLGSEINETRHQLHSGINETRHQLHSEIIETRDQLRSEVIETRDQLRSEMIETRDQLRSEMNHQYADLVERIADSETRLLKGFYDYASSNNKRVTELEGNEAAIRSRLATLEDRMLQVEKRLNMPPAA